MLVGQKKYTHQEEGLLRRFGSPLFVVSESVLQEKYRTIRKSMDDYYPNSTIAYSFKTNYIPGICAVFKKAGAGAEVVSGFEYGLAKKLGYDGENIIFNGPYKKEEDLERAIKDNCTLNIDNIEELKRAAAIAERLGTSTAIGIRVFSETLILTYGTWGRFGFCVEDGEAFDVFTLIRNEFKGLNVVGLHVHLGTNIPHPETYQAIIRTIGKFVSRLKEEYGFSPAYIDIGGGIAIPGNQPVGKDFWRIPPVREYCKAIGELMHEQFSSHPPLLIVEPGRYLVGEAAVFLTSVISVKKLDKDKQKVVVDSSINMMPSATFIRHPITALGTGDKLLASSLFGISCTQTDILGEALLPPLCEGDILTVHNVGAYSMSRSNQWISPRPAVIMLHDNGEVTLLRRREREEDMVSLDPILGEP